ncbi:MAG TPA: malto-oligosyltrehalose synthase, partial [Puia sp.]
MFLPNSTYRIQLNDKFTLRDLENILPYLYRLGIGAIYASPLTTASKGSQHGYDVIDPLVLNPEMGTEDDWYRITLSLKRYGIGWIQDIVPNHMAYEMRNAWLFDVLQRGRDSAFFEYFDIDNDPPAQPLGERLLAPFLGSPLEECLQKGELSLQSTQRGFVIRYFSTDWPVAVRLYRHILTVENNCPPALLATLDPLEAALTQEPVRWKLTMEAWLRQVDNNVEFREFITGRCAFFNLNASFLQALLEHQPYRLSHFAVADQHINYRRFFTINSLMGLSMEKEPVFNAWHAAFRRWAGQGRINGLRIDHIDGLADPKAYLQRLRQLFGPECPIYVEKILHHDEPLPADWPVQGTTGYEALADISQVLTDAAGSRRLLDFYREKIVDGPEYEELVYRRKHHYLQTKMGGEWENLFNRLRLLPCAGAQDVDRLKQALGVWMASFPSYRAYPDAGGVSAAGREMMATAVDRARRHEPGLGPELDFLAALFEKDDALTFVRRLMQFTGPLAAKGIEDTVFYVYNPYIAHCEVGDSPALAGIAPEAFHQRMQVRRATQPHSLNASTTHDTKRGEDARIRLNYLSAIPGEWRAAVLHWRELNAPLIKVIGGRPAPSPNDEYLIYQALLGAWPEEGAATDAFRERFAGYLTKALREADTETHYSQVDEAYEGQCQAFVKTILRPGSPFADSFLPLAQSVIRQSAVYCLSQLLLKITAPGIPDIYQGAELWETSLVDPDNRRPVDYSGRAALLNVIRIAEANGPGAAMEAARRHAAKGAEKLYTLYRSLAVRNRLPSVFASGDYLPLVTE